MAFVPYDALEVAADELSCEIVQGGTHRYIITIDLSVKALEALPKETQRLEFLIRSHRVKIYV